MGAQPGVVPTHIRLRHEILGRSAALRPVGSVNMLTKSDRHSDALEKRRDQQRGLALVLASGKRMVTLGVAALDVGAWGALSLVSYDPISDTISPIPVVAFRADRMKMHHDILVKLEIEDGVVAYREETVLVEW